MCESRAYRIDMPQRSSTHRKWIHPADSPEGHWETLDRPIDTLPLERTLLDEQLGWLSHPASVEKRNWRNVLIDGIGVGIASGIGSFLSVFLVRLGASSFLVGLLTAMPALTGILLAISVGQFLTRQRQIVPWFSLARLLVISCYALTGLVPFVFRENVAEIIVAIWALATLPQTVVSVGFTVVMGQVAGPRGRVALMSQRWSILGFANALAVSSC